MLSDSDLGRIARCLGMSLEELKERLETCNVDVNRGSYYVELSDRGLWKASV